ncbi:class I adenylate-forming enzyme family protein [Phaeospirillum tilakii]|uniref:Class I adenylate-forming enzyme family protein n=1 Tax=Phaeospirillum tilakii TaxID=741673 RepID=A0ABW5CB83_9PROT
MNLASYLERHAQRQPDRDALRFEGRSVTFAELDRDAGRLAAALHRRGIGPGDRVALYLPNQPQFLVAYYAVQKLGAVAVSVNPMFKSDEVRYLLEDSAAAAVLAPAGLTFHVPADCPGLRLRIVVDDGPAGPDWLALGRLYAEGAAGFTPIERAADDPAALLYSSGTTGQPKGVVLTQRNIHSNIALSACCSDLRPGDRVAAFLPLFHAYGQNYLMNGAMLAGATLVLFPRYSPETVLAAIGAERVTHLFAVPAIFIALLASDLAPYDLSSLRYEMSAAATLPEEISRRWFDRFGRRIYEGYGLTECAPFACYNDFHQHRFGSVGRPLPGVEARVVDETGAELPPGAIGEIVLRGDNVMAGYWNRPDDSARALRGGWLHTGDIGRIDEHGYLYLCDRLKDMINVSGFKVWPAEIEAGLYRLDGVREVAVYGRPDPDKGECVVAAVVAKEGAALTPEAVIAYCRDHMAAYKVPSRVDILDALPRSATGKLLKRVLREQA